MSERKKAEEERKLESMKEKEKKLYPANKLTN
jgi:hypothetical protein